MGAWEAPGSGLEGIDGWQTLAIDGRVGGAGSSCIERNRHNGASYTQVESAVQREIVRIGWAPVGVLDDSHLRRRWYLLTGRPCVVRRLQQERTAGSPRDFNGLTNNNEKT